MFKNLGSIINSAITSSSTTNGFVSFRLNNDQVSNVTSSTKVPVFNSLEDETLQIVTYVANGRINNYSTSDGSVMINTLKNIHMNTTVNPGLWIKYKSLEHYYYVSNGALTTVPLFRYKYVDTIRFSLEERGKRELNCIGYVVNSDKNLIAGLKGASLFGLNYENYLLLGEAQMDPKTIEGKTINNVVRDGVVTEVHMSSELIGASIINSENKSIFYSCIHHEFTAIVEIEKLYHDTVLNAREVNDSFYAAKIVRNDFKDNNPNVDYLAKYIYINGVLNTNILSERDFSAAIVIARLGMIELYNFVDYINGYIEAKNSFFPKYKLKYPNSSISFFSNDKVVYEDKVYPSIITQYYKSETYFYLQDGKLNNYVQDNDLKPAIVKLYSDRKPREALFLNDGTINSVYYNNKLIPAYIEYNRYGGILSTEHYKNNIRTNIYDEILKKDLPAILKFYDSNTDSNTNIKLRAYVTNGKLDNKIVNDINVPALAIYYDDIGKISALLSKINPYTGETKLLDAAADFAIGGAVGTLGLSAVVATQLALDNKDKFINSVYDVANHLPQAPDMINSVSNMIATTYNNIPSTNIMTDALSKIEGVTSYLPDASTLANAQDYLSSLTGAASNVTSVVPNVTSIVPDVAQNATSVVNATQNYGSVADLVPNVLSNTTGFIANVGSNVTDIFSQAASNLTQAASNVTQAINPMQAASNLTQAASNVTQAINPMQAASNVTQAISSAPITEVVGNVGSGIGSGIGSGVSATVQEAVPVASVFETLSGAASGLSSAATQYASSATGYASSGLTSASQFVTGSLSPLVGETVASYAPLALGVGAAAIAGAGIYYGTKSAYNYYQNNYGSTSDKTNVPETDEETVANDGKVINNIPDQENIDRKAPEQAKRGSELDTTISRTKKIKASFNFSDGILTDIVTLNIQESTDDKGNVRRVPMNLSVPAIKEFNKEGLVIKEHYTANNSSSYLVKVWENNAFYKEYISNKNIYDYLFYNIFLLDNISMELQTLIRMN